MFERWIRDQYAETQRWILENRNAGFHGDWRDCSRQWASINLLDREELGRNANVRTLRMTASFKNVLSVTAISASFSVEARRLFALRAQ
jgi:hypothetical protein